MERLYRYVGPAAIAESARTEPVGTPIRSRMDLAESVRDTAPRSVRDARVTFTYVVDGSGELRVADRHTEHVACAGGGPVMAAGELVADTSGVVHEVSNQSTGFCPEPSCWASLARALERAGIEHPSGFTAAFEFRRCTRCGSITLVKEVVFECAACDAELPRAWNFE